MILVLYYFPSHFLHLTKLIAQFSESPELQNLNFFTNIFIGYLYNVIKPPSY